MVPDSFRSTGVYLYLIRRRMGSRLILNGLVRRFVGGASDCSYFQMSTSALFFRGRPGVLRPRAT
jgi:hypothetical protein